MFCFSSRSLHNASSIKFGLAINGKYIFFVLVCVVSQLGLFILRIIAVKCKSIASRHNVILRRANRINSNREQMSRLLCRARIPKFTSNCEFSQRCESQDRQSRFEPTDKRKQNNMWIISLNDWLYIAQLTLTARSQ